MNKEEIKDRWEAHPLYSEYGETFEIMRELREKAEDGNDMLNERIDILEERISDLTRQMAKDIDPGNQRLEDPELADWDNAWSELRRVKREGRPEKEDAIWAEITTLAEKLDAKKVFSNN